MGGSSERRNRVNRLKRLILTVITAAIIIPIIICIILGFRVCRLQTRVNELEALLTSNETEAEEKESVYTVAPVRESSRDTLKGEKNPENVSGDEEQKTKPENYQKQVYLTFDDGPSRNTDRILDILKEYDVKATFFVVGKTDENSVRAYQRIVDEGHTLGMHSYSHKYDEIYESKESFVEDMDRLQEYLYQTTGIWSRFYRFPGGSSNTVSKVDMQELISYFNECGITYYDWNISSGDAASAQISVDSLVDNCVNGIEGKNVCMILMHDSSAKNNTVEALPKIIERIQSRGDAEILPISDDTVPIQHITAE